MTSSTGAAGACCCWVAASRWRTASGAAPKLPRRCPSFFPTGRETFHRDPATVSLTPAGVDSVITRLVDDSARNIERWKKLPYLMDYQDPGKPKPGATVLAEMHGGERAMPLLVTENYGRGRTAVLATGGTWRWQMSLPLGDKSSRPVLAATPALGWYRARADG